MFTSKHCDESMNQQLNYAFLFIGFIAVCCSDICELIRHTLI
jgi:hypothetical protein